MKKIVILILISVLLVGCSFNHTNNKINNDINYESKIIVEQPIDKNTCKEDKKNMSKKLTKKEIITNSKLLTEQFVSYVFSKDNLDGISELSDLNLFHFFMSTSYFRDNTKYLYNDYSVLSDDKMYFIFKLEYVQKIIKEISGEEDWFVNFSNSYNQDEKSFKIPICIGVIGSYSSEVKEAKFVNENTIEVKCNISDRSGYEYMIKNYGTYKVVFELIKEEDRDYLRFKELKKVDK